MHVVAHPDAASVATVAGEAMAAQPAMDNLPLGLLNRLTGNEPRENDAPVLLTAHEGDRLCGVALCTPPWPLVLSVVTTPEAAAELARHAPPGMTAVNGAVGGPAAFADVYAALHGLTATPGRQMRVFELRAVTWPERPAPGRLRRATPADHALLATWFEAFHAEAVPEDPLDAQKAATGAIEGQRAWFWDDDGPVSFACSSRRLPGGISVGPVYTPPEQRGRGYATVMTAALSQTLLDEGYDFCCLFTDLANPTSNGIYPRVGYRPVGDYTRFDFNSTG